MNKARIAALVVCFAFGAAACSGAENAADGAETQEARECETPQQSRVYIPGGSFVFGTETGLPEEGPATEVTVGGFWIETHEVTVAQFAAFVAATAYVTVAERPVDGSQFPDAPPEMLAPGSAVFQPRKDAPVQSYMSWWKYVPGANWRKPLGPDGPDSEDNQPVTQLAFEDAQAYAKWAGGRLPSEVEWEYAARGGAAAPEREEMSAPAEANTWQGPFPVYNSMADGFEAIAPVGCFAPNGFGLYDMIGNVWELTSDWYVAGHALDDATDPDGPSLQRSRNETGMEAHVVKGGSFLCAENYCRRYRVSARHAQDASLGTNHTGFRLVYDGPAP